ncbi:hypothetical protein [Nocardioides aquiterrae]|uniref:Uncharacterized protein n=1 Tax=Nocardioides aquiterrae TaxID=203799 RepID=A0ABP4FC52_9ACTN
MAQHVMTDQVGVRFGIACGALFLLTAGVVSAPLSGGYGVAALLLVTGLLATTLDRSHALGLGLAGWAFATGFAVHALGVLTFAPSDLARLGAFVLLAVLTSRGRAGAE